MYTKGQVLRRICIPACSTEMTETEGHSY